MNQLINEEIFFIFLLIIMAISLAYNYLKKLEAKINKKTIKKREQKAPTRAEFLALEKRLVALENKWRIK